MSMDTVAYQGYGIDLGQFEPTFHGRDAKVNEHLQNIWNEFISNENEKFDLVDADGVGNYAPDVDTIYPCNTNDFTLLLIIETAYTVYDEHKKPAIKVYTTAEADKVLVEAFNHLFDNWNYYTEVANDEEANLIKQGVDEMINDHADFDYNQGPWSDEV